MTTFAKALRSVFYASSMSQVRVSKAAGIDHSYLSRLMSGDRDRPLESVVLALADALECDDEDRDRLLMAAGYLPLDRTNVFLDQPELRAVVRMALKGMAA